MGEMAEMLLNGTMCSGCGEWLHDGEDGDGFPGYCASCAPDSSPKKIWMEGPRLLKITRSFVKDFEKRLGGQMNQQLFEYTVAAVSGIIARHYVCDGRVRNDGMERTITNNVAAQEKARKRKEKAKLKLAKGE